MWPTGAAPLFDALVIDEAAQALEPATLIPFQLIKPGASRIILVGDPRQLPPTVLSKAAEGARLAQSLFERLQRCGWPVCMLDEQYRMHPDISRFPSKFFYEGRLLDGVGINTTSRGALFHKQPCFAPFVVWDCQEGREHGGGKGGKGGSLRNVAEAEVAAVLAAGLLRSYPGEVGSIVVITPYRAQLGALRSEFRRELGGDAALAAAGVEFGTVDGFQGREADVVIFSCVRAQPGAVSNGGGARVGFLADVRRMNVGLTRARRALWVVCHASTLQRSDAWRPLLEEASNRQILYAAKQPFRRLLTSTASQLEDGAPRVRQNSGADNSVTKSSHAAVRITGGKSRLLPATEHHAAGSVSATDGSRTTNTGSRDVANRGGKAASTSSDNSVHKQANGRSAADAGRDDMNDNAGAKQDVKLRNAHAKRPRTDAPASADSKPLSVRPSRLITDSNRLQSSRHQPPQQYSASSAEDPAASMDQPTKQTVSEQQITASTSSQAPPIPQQSHQQQPSHVPAPPQLQQGLPEAGQQLLDDSVPPLPSSDADQGWGGDADLPPLPSSPPPPLPPA